MEEDAERQRDEGSLRLLRIGYFVLAVLALAGVVFGGFYVLMGISLTARSRVIDESAPPEGIGWILTGAGVLTALIAGAYALLCFLSARAIRRRQARALCLVTAGFSCLQLPLGTIVGVFTFIVLGRRSVQRLFAANDAVPPP